MDSLPPRATAASHTRYRIAQELSELCPPVLGQEIAITGSVSKGLADDPSDIEQVFYVQEIPGVQARDTWLRQIGASAIIHDETTIEDGSLWSTFRFGEIWIEAGWQTFRQQEELLRQILAAQVLDHHRLILGEITSHALSLRGEGHLPRWRQQLTQYPPQLAQRLIANATDLWQFPHLLEARWALAQRHEPWRLAEVLLRELHNILRVLFALNHQWEPEWKWISQSSGALALKPHHLMERSTAIFTENDAKQRIAACIQLIYDTLTLLPVEYDVAQALNTVRESLDLHSY
ncbi:DUF4037 domain-containing protein [Dictyobacter halimunensis]